MRSPACEALSLDPTSINSLAIVGEATVFPERPLMSQILSPDLTSNAAATPLELTRALGLLSVPMYSQHPLS